MYIDFLDSIVGTIKLIADDEYLKKLEFIDKKDKYVNKNKITDETKRQLKNYFQKKIKKFNLPLDLSGTEFQKKNVE